MSLLAALQALASTGVFTSRAFLPLFVLSVVARFPNLLDWLPLIPHPPVLLPASLGWLASTWCLVALGLLSGLEVWADKHHDAREALAIIEPPLKAAAAFLASYALVGRDSADVLRRIGESAPHAAMGQSSALAAGIAAAAAAYGLARYRLGVLEHVRAAGDDIGLSRVVSWAEDAWASGGMLLCLFAPILAVLVAGGLALIFFVALRAIEARADSRRVPCPACSRRNRAEAMICGGCAHVLEPGVEPSSRAWPDRWLELPASRARKRRAAGLDLLGQGRCPACAERRAVAELMADLPHACGWPDGETGVAGRGWPEELASHVSRRAARLAAPAAVAGLVPVVGPAVAIVLARLRVQAAVRRYLPTTTRMKSRWKGRALSLALLVFCGLPLVSALVSALLVGAQWIAWVPAFRRNQRAP